MSLVEAGVRLRGLGAGPVCSPLTEPAPEHVEEPPDLIDRGRALHRTS